MIGRCQVRYGVNDHVRCEHLGIGGRCLGHWLELARLEQHLGPLTLRIDLSNLNRPYVQVDEERPIGWASIEYGNRNSDPMFDLYWSRKG